MKITKRTLKKILCGVLLAIGIACIGVALGLPLTIPVLVPVGVICLGGSFGMFQGTLSHPAPNNDGESHNPQQESDVGEIESDTSSHVVHMGPHHNNVNMLFMYNNSIPENGIPHLSLQPQERTRPALTLT